MTKPMTSADNQLDLEDLLPPRTQRIEVVVTHDQRAVMRALTLTVPLADYNAASRRDGPALASKLIAAIQSVLTPPTKEPTP